MGCNHQNGQALTWGLNAKQQATVFCLGCREVLLRYVPPVEAKIFVDEYREGSR